MDEMNEAVRALRIERLGQLIRAKRKEDGLTLEQAAEQSGVSAPTLSRLERWKAPSASPAHDEAKKGSPEPDTRTLAAISHWLGVSLDSIVAQSSTPHRRMGESVPDVITAHLRADRNLSSEAAEALSNMFRVAYQQFAASPSGKSPMDMAVEPADREKAA